MKKRILRERRTIIEETVNNEVKNLTKQELMKMAKERGLEVNSRMTKAELEEIIKGA